MDKNLIILSDSAGFPWGMAASNRVRCLSKAAMIEGWNCTYLGLRGANIQTKKDSRYKYHGWIEGIHYCYPGLFAQRSNNWLLRRIDDLLCFINTILFILVKKISLSIDVIIIYSNNINFNWFWIEFSRFLKIPVILEMCEWPPEIPSEKRNGRSKAENFCLNILPRADAVLPISTYIYSKIDKIAKHKRIVIPSFRIPILIDDEKSKFANDTTIAESQFMLYCGSIQYIDIAMFVVDIVCELKKFYIELPVKFTGDANDSRFTELKRYAEQKKVISLFNFTGFIEEEKLLSLMRKAVCLLAPLPEDRRSQSRFPTKIGYYLCSARPVVTNAIGDVTKYLQDYKNAFVTKNYDAKQFALRIKYILNNKEVSNKIGAAGRSLAMQKFHYSVACNGFSQFLKEVIENY